MIFLSNPYIKNLRTNPNSIIGIRNEFFIANLLNTVDEDNYLLGETGYPDLIDRYHNNAYEIVQCDLAEDLDSQKILFALAKHHYRYEDAIQDELVKNVNLLNYEFNKGKDGTVIAYWPRITPRGSGYFLSFFEKNITNKLKKLNHGNYSKCKSVSLVISAICRYKEDSDIKVVVELYKKCSNEFNKSFDSLIIITTSKIYKYVEGNCQVVLIDDNLYSDTVKLTNSIIDKVIKKETLYSYNPEIAMEWDFVKNLKTPIDYGSKSAEKVWWLCSKGHSYDGVIHRRTIRGNGCPYCSGHRVWPGFNDLQTTHPKIAEQWHPTLNGDKNPTQYSKGSMEVVWWLCPKGHAYKKDINAKKESNDCPYCTHRETIPGETDLATTNPEIAQEWDYEKNYPLKPTDVFAKSDKKVWWRCPQGHSYRAGIHHRTTDKTGCPECAKENKVSFPEKMIYFYLSKQFKNIEENYNGGLPSNANIDIYLPDYKIGIEYDGAHWHKDPAKDLKKNANCKSLGICLIRIREKGCPILNSSSLDYYVESDDYLAVLKCLKDALYKIAEIKFDYSFDLAKDSPLIDKLIFNKTKENTIANYPHLLEEWDYEKNGNIDPRFISSGSDRKYFWKCSKGHSWKTSPLIRKRGSECPYCTNRLLLEGYNDLQHTHPGLENEWDYEKNDKKPNQVMKGSAEKVWWKCPHGHSYKIEIREKKEGYCPICEMNIIQEGVNDLTTMYPDVMEDWDYKKNIGINPRRLSPFSIKKVWWKCKHCGHEWEQRIYRRTKDRTICPRCKNKA